MKGSYVIGQKPSVFPFPFSLDILIKTLMVQKKLQTFNLMFHQSTVQSLHHARTLILLFLILPILVVLLRRYSTLKERDNRLIGLLGRHPGRIVHFVLGANGLGMDE